MPWKINKTDKDVIVSFDALGSFITKEDAIEEAKKLARDYKLVVRVFASDDFGDREELMTIDYTSFFNSKEMIERTTSELKLAKAEVNVAILELKQRMREYKQNKDETDRLIIASKIKNSKIRLKKAKLKLRAAKKRFQKMTT